MRHVGDPVAFVVAVSAELAKDAAEVVIVDYDILPACTDLATATEPGQPLVWGKSTTSASIGKVAIKTKTDDLFSRAAHVTQLKVVNNRIVVASMEGRAARASYDLNTGKFTLHAGTQGSWHVKDMLSKNVFKLLPEQFRVVTSDVGGGSV